MSTRLNVHGTAIVLGATGILIAGASGAGKSALALSLISAARLRGLFAALVADDQVFVTAANGRLVAEAPPAIAGLIELRGTGLARLERCNQLDAACLDLAVHPLAPGAGERLPEAAATLALAPGLALPAINLSWPSPDPFSFLAAACPGLESGLVARPRLVEG